MYNPDQANNSTTITTVTKTPYPPPSDSQYIVLSLHEIHIQLSLK